MARGSWPERGRPGVARPCLSLAAPRGERAQLGMTGGSSERGAGWPVPRAQRGRTQGFGELAEHPERPEGFILASGLGPPQLLTYPLSGILDFRHGMIYRAA